MTLIAGTYVGQIVPYNDDDDCDGFAFGQGSYGKVTGNLAIFCLIIFQRFRLDGDSYQFDCESSTYLVGINWYSYSYLDAIQFICG